MDTQRIPYRRPTIVHRESVEGYLVIDTTTSAQDV
jgi:hypothetical protein